MRKKIVIFYFIILLLPVMGLAFSPGNVPESDTNLDINNLIDKIFNFIWPIVMAALIFIFLGIGILFALAQGDPGKLASARLALIGAVAVTALAILAFSIPFVIRNMLDV